MATLSVMRDYASSMNLSHHTMLSSARIISAGKSIFDHGLEEYLENKASVKTIDTQVLKDLVLSRPLEFCAFVHDFAWRINGDSYDLKTQLRDTRSKESTNLFRCIEMSDIAYALLLLVIKRNGWIERRKKQQDAMREATDNANTDPNPKKKAKKKKAAKSKMATRKNPREDTEDEADDSEGEGGTVETGSEGTKRMNTKSRKGWVIGNRAADRKQGFERIGVVFYQTVKEALEGVEMDEFEVAWRAYYETLDHKGTSNGGHVSKNAWEKKRKRAVEVESDSEVDEGAEVELSEPADESWDEWGV